MAVAEAETVATRECPACGGAMEQTHTICAKCRAELEAHVMSAPAPVAAVAASIAPAVAIRPTPPVAQATASLRPPAAAAPTRAPAQPVGRLESRSRWQHSVIAIGLVILAAGVAFGLWSFLTPHGDAEPAQSPMSPPAREMKPPAPVVPAEAPAHAPVAQPKPQPATAPTTVPTRTVRPATRPANRPTTKPAGPRGAQPK